VINTASSDQHPAISKDGLSLYITSNRPGGLGGNDLYRTTREKVPGGRRFAAPLLEALANESDPTQQTPPAARLPAAPTVEPTILPAAGADSTRTISARLSHPSWMLPLERVFADLDSVFPDALGEMLDTARVD
jgi:hypothetical protein